MNQVQVKEALEAALLPLGALVVERVTLERYHSPGMQQAVRVAHDKVLAALAALPDVERVCDVVRQLRDFATVDVRRGPAIAGWSEAVAAADALLAPAEPAAHKESAKELAARLGFRPLTPEQECENLDANLSEPSARKFSELRDQPVLSATKTADGFQVVPAAPSGEERRAPPGELPASDSTEAAQGASSSGCRSDRATWPGESTTSPPTPPPEATCEHGTPGTSPDHCIDEASGSYGLHCPTPEPAAPSGGGGPVCDRCTDTHVMDLDGKIVPCTACPTPCQKCRAGGNGPFCEATPCSCDCHRKAAPTPEPAAGIPRLTLTHWMRAICRCDEKVDADGLCSCVKWIRDSALAARDAELAKIREERDGFFIQMSDGTKRNALEVMREALCEREQRIAELEGEVNATHAANLRQLKLLAERRKRIAEMWRRGDHLLNLLLRAQENDHVYDRSGSCSGGPFERCSANECVAVRHAREGWRILTAEPKGGA